MEVRYAPGDGMLLARGERWLLVGVSDPADVVPVLDQLWHDLDQPAGFALALATVRRHLAGASLAWLDATTGDHDAEGGAAVTSHGDRWELTLGTPATAATMRLVEGVVFAAALQVTGNVPVAGEVPSATGAMIDGIPPEILAAPREAPTPPPTALPQDTTHDHHTRTRSGTGPTGPPAPTTSHLEQSTSDTVLAVRCELGHLTDPLMTMCRACGNPVPPQEPARVLRPPLGVLRLPDGESVLLDRPVVLGRRPAPSGPGDWPHLVRLPHDSTYLSRLHVRIDLDGWLVMVQDLGSRGGTTLFSPGRDPEKIRGHEPHLLESGTTLDLAGAYQVTYLSTIPTNTPPIEGETT
ncbi:MAG: FHA domain-containing protein [Nocardioides sp.]